MEELRLATDLLGQYETLILQMFLNADPQSSFNGRQISRETGVPKTTTHRIITKYHEIGLLTGDEHLSMTLYKVNRNHILYPIVEQLLGIEKKFYTKIIEDYSPFFPELTTFLKYPANHRPGEKNNNTINILCVTKNDSDLDLEKIDNITDHLSLESGSIINVRIITDADVRKMKRTKDKFLTQINKHGELLHGPELTARSKP